MNDVKFRRPVVPGDQLRDRGEHRDVEGRPVQDQGEGVLLKGNLATEATMMCVMADRESRANTRKMSEGQDPRASGGVAARRNWAKVCKSAHSR